MLSGSDIGQHRRSFSQCCILDIERHVEREAVADSSCFRTVFFVLVAGRYRYAEYRKGGKVPVQFVSENTFIHILCVYLLVLFIVLSIL